MLKFKKLKIQNSFFSRVFVFSFLMLFCVTLINATTYYSKADSDPSKLNSWTTDTVSTGQAPSNFSTNGDVFVIRATHNMTLAKDSTLTVGGGSKTTVVTLLVRGKISLTNNNSHVIISSYSFFIVESQETVVIKQGKSTFEMKPYSTLITYNSEGIVSANGGIFANDDKKLILPATTQLNVVYAGDAPVETVYTSIYPDCTVTNATPLIISSNVNYNTLTIQPGAKITQNTGTTLLASKIVILSDETNGTGTFVSNGTVITGTASVQQYIKGGRNWYVSSPVDKALVTNLTTGASKASSVVYYNEPTTWVTAAVGATLNPGTGYIAVSPDTNGLIEFSGTKFNTGDVTVSNLTISNFALGFNLVGNPYPSYTDWTKLEKTNLLSSIWYRTKNQSGSYVFDTFKPGLVDMGTSNNGTGEVTKWIPPMQAFWVRVDPSVLFSGSATGKLTFKNDSRGHQDIVTNKLRVKAETNSDPKVVRLQVSNGVNSDEAIVYFHADASNDFDKYDSQKMTNNNLKIPEIYTTAGGENLVINGLNSIPMDEEIALGFFTRESNTFSIKATQLKNFDENVKLYLKDRSLGVEQLLDLDNDYTFSSDVYSSTDRFSLIFKTISLTTEAPEMLDNSISIVKVNNSIVVNCDSEPKGVISVYNALGQFITSESIQSKQTKIDMKGYSGVCFVKANSLTNKNTIKIHF